MVDVDADDESGPKIGKRILKERSITWPGARHMLHERGLSQAHEQFINDD